jgi:putative membrane protein
MLALVIRIIVNAIALWVCTLVIPGITAGGHGVGGQAGTLIIVALIFGIVNAVLKPIVHTLGCAFYLLTLGLFALVVNALLFLLAGYLAGRVGLDFHVSGFSAAFFGAILVAIVSFVLHLIIPDRYDERS